MVRKALTFLAVLSMNLRNVRAAIDDSTEALELAIELDDRLAQSAVATNIGGFLLELFYYDDALQLFRFALAIAPNTPQAQQITRTTMCNMALIYVAKHDFRAGIDTIRSAIQLLGEPTTAADLWLRVLMEWCYTRLLLTTGKVATDGPARGAGQGLCRQSRHAPRVLLRRRGRGDGARPTRATATSPSRASSSRSRSRAPFPRTSATCWRA